MSEEKSEKRNANLILSGTAEMAVRSVRIAMIAVHDRRGPAETGDHIAAHGDN